MPHELRKYVGKWHSNLHYAIATVLLLGGSSNVHSVIASSPAYDVRHLFNLNIKGNQDYRGTWYWNNHDLAMSSAAPPSENFGPPPGTLLNAVPGALTKAVTSVGSGGATANASADYSANANGAGNVHINGGGACVGTCTLARAESGSAIALSRGTIDRKGNFTWRPIWSLVVVRTGAFQDPVDLSFQDLDTNTTQSSRLFDLDVQLPAAGSSTMFNGELTISGTDGSFSLNQLSQYLVNGTGMMSLTFQNGIVTQSIDSGIYDGLLPAVGTSSLAIGFHLGDAGGNINLDFDFGPSNTSGYDMTAQLGNSAFVEVPEPGTFVLAILGLLSGVITLKCRGPVS